MRLIHQGVNSARAGVRSALRSVLSQERRTELKRLQGLARKRCAPVLSLVHGTFTTEELIADLSRRLPADFEILMVHSSFDGFLPMYKGTAKELLAALIDFCGPNRTLVMPSFVMGGRTYDSSAYFRTHPFDVRRTPSEVGLIAEIFRRTPNVLRSLHPTCSVCALGPLAKEITTGHHLSETGLSPDSPFGVMTRGRTAILGLGVEYYRCLTHAHTAGHQMGEAFPIKFSNPFTQVTLIDYDGSRFEYRLGLPDRTKKLDLTIIWSLLSANELMEWRYHGIPMFLIPSAGVLTDRLIEAAHRGITIYGKA
ncbi:AAC(3) family N-acetyltransferase [Acidobacterium sp. S8]|uniref:AAC(3) family N-acetyltransferase n=1 Tax=Acidobacterium sp. S8 TaxID=1641854 RepID=UPI00131D837A|nr:AAC(3) family N-acetyltransferase [Acidobacterium sp. S8]